MMENICECCVSLTDISLTWLIEKGKNIFRSIVRNRNKQKMIIAKLFFSIAESKHGIGKCFFNIVRFG